jgi:AraC family transcriptional regulator
MNMATEVLNVWNQFAENMHLKDSPTGEVKVSTRASFSFGRVKSSEGLPEISRSGGGRPGYLVALQLRAIPFLEQFLDNKSVSRGSYPVGGVSALHLREAPTIVLPNPFDTLALFVTQGALDEVAYAHRAPRVERLVWPHGALDATVHHLGQTLVTSLEQPHHTSKIFLDHVLHALNCHFVCSYGGMKISAPQFRGGLSSLQMRIATGLLEAHLDGDIALGQVAKACELSLSHFARAFKQTFRTPPYKWLTERRVDRARDLMTNSRLSLAEIAVQCGFADQSALNRSFKRIHGFTPGMWRRKTAPGNQ